MNCCYNSVIASILIDCMQEIRAKDTQNLHGKPGSRWFFCGLTCALDHQSSHLLYVSM